MAATVATVAYLGLEARAVEVQVQLSSGLPRFTIVGLPGQRGRARAANACARRSPRSAWRSRPRSSPSTCRRPTCRRRDRITICRSRSGLLAAIGATDAEALSQYVAVGELCLDGRIAASPGVLLAAIHASCARQGPDLPRRRRAARRAGRDSSTSLPRPTCWRCSRISRARRSSRRRSPPKRSRPTAAPTSRRSRVRKSPSARSRSPRRAVTIC